MDFSFVKHFKRDKSNTSILVLSMEKAKKIDFAIGLSCLDAISLKSKENDKKKVEKLRKRLLL